MTSAADTIAAHVVCAVDGSPPSLVALRQGARLAGNGRVDIVTVADRSIAVHAGWAMSDVLEKVERDARDALAEAESEADSAESTVLHGDPARSILEHVESRAATLVAVGARGHGRVAGIMVGSVATTLLHSAPCSVLVAREGQAPDAFPERILVGLDGSEAAALAAEVAQGLAARFGSELVALAATEGKTIDVAAARASFPGAFEEYPKSPVSALVETSGDADLVVLGSRGLHGLKALGSVSERVAHRARCSVLVVRPTAS